MRLSRRRLGTCVFWSSVVFFAGCGDGDGLPREPVSGVVTLDGQPLAVGSIQFLPSSPDQGTPASGEIAAGKFTIPRDRGPVPGQYRVIISGGAPAPALSKDAPPGESPPPPPDPVPAKYNADTTLVAEIKAGGPNTFEYALKK